MSSKNNGKKEVGVLIAVVLGGLAVFVAIQLFLTSTADGGFNKRVQTITYKEFDSKVDNGESFVLIYGQKGCSACDSYKPIVGGTLKDGYKDVPVYYVDAATYSDEDRAAIASYLGAENTPTTYVFSKGVDIYSVEGVQSEEDLKEILEMYKTYK